MFYAILRYYSYLRNHLHAFIGQSFYYQRLRDCHVDVHTIVVVYCKWVGGTSGYYDDVTRASRRFRSPATWLFVTNLFRFRLTPKISSNPTLLAPLWGASNAVDSPHKWSVIRKASPWHHRKIVSIVVVDGRPVVNGHISHVTFEQGLSQWDKLSVKSRHMVTAP